MRACACVCECVCRDRWTVSGEEPPLLRHTRVTMPNSHLALQEVLDVTSYVVPGPQGLRLWKPEPPSGAWQAPWRPPSRPALSCGDFLREGAQGGEARRGPSSGGARRTRGGGVREAFWGGRPGRGERGAAGGLEGAGRVAKSCNRQ